MIGLCYDIINKFDAKNYLVKPVGKSVMWFLALPCLYAFCYENYENLTTDVYLYRYRYLRYLFCLLCSSELKYFKYLLEDRVETQQDVLST